ncbi:MAG: SusD/RagB family nutrient-binding outer membrane lipoprotein [Prevotellaceae bacterium]|jgi:hypothetical protein|nr:SusD/RagB family nutrient-binding outer membrane lipoprotein [Prevotellaceae bacterium]
MKKIISVFVMIAGLCSCEQYLDINTDPNSPAEENVSADMILPAAEMNLAASYGNYLRIVGGYYAQHYAQTFGTSNYVDYSEFKMSATRSSGTYTQLYARTLKNLETVRRQAEEAEEWGTYLAATTLRVFTFQVLVDAYGEVPYAQSLDVATVSPEFDHGEDVYSGILAELNAALAKAAASDQVCANFLFGATTAGEWIKFANALKLKILMRTSKVNNVQAELAALVAEDDFPTEDVSWDDCWADEIGKANPFYLEEEATSFGSNQKNVVANIAYMRTMTDVNDGRTGSFFKKNSVGSGSYTGGVSGTNFSTTPDHYPAAYFCRPQFAYNMPVYLITVSEVEFFLAEYHARYGTAANAEAHYKAAIDASFESAGATGAEDVYAATSPYAWSTADYEKLIGIQKWIALGGVNNFEGWCELRRLKYPAFGAVTGKDLYDETDNSANAYKPDLYVAGTLYTPINFNTELGAGKVLQRFRYAEASSSRNSNAPANRGDATPVFWAE